MNTEEKRFMKIAIDLAKDNIKNNNGGPFGAIIVRNGEIIATGVNNVTKNNDPTAHAEITAIRNACKKLETFELNDCEIYSSCEPCPMCLGAIYWARFKKLYFAASKNDAASIGFDDAFIYNEFNKPYKERNIECIQIMRDEAVKAFEIWEKIEDKIQY